jgi:hypothetical protein
MEITLNFKKQHQALLESLLREYPDLCFDDEVEPGILSYYIADDWHELEYEDAVEFCGFAEGLIPSARCMIEGNGPWAQGMISRTDFSRLAISDAAKQEYERLSCIYHAALSRARTIR